MIKKILVIVYLLIVIFLVIESSLITWTNDPRAIFFMEISVDIVILVGIILSLNDKTIKWWVIPFVFSAIGEAFLLIIDTRVGIKEAIQWALILLPAIYFNLKVSGYIGNRKWKSENV